MATPLDMSLDDVIKRNNREKGRGRGMARRGRGTHGFSTGGRIAVPGRRGPPTVDVQPYAITKPPRRNKIFSWQHDLFEDSLKAAGISGIEIGTKLCVSNLDYGVTNDDIRELFSKIGDMRRFALHYDKNGRPSGSAEVVYMRRSDAFAAQRRYDNVILDGKPMKIELVGTNAEFPVSASLNVNGDNGRGKKRTFVAPRPPKLGGSAVFKRSFGQSRGRGGLRSSRGGGRGRGRGRGRGWVKKKPVEKSADELDKELESYHADAMQT